jgi:hypothetical protein
MATLLHGKSYALIFDKKLGLATFWAFFSQTHPVTLTNAWHGRVKNGTFHT